MKLDHMMFAMLATALLGAIAAPRAHAQELPENHTVVRPTAAPAAPLWLGLTLKSATSTGEPGVEVTRILRRSPADGTGVQPGDRITHIGDVAVDSTRDVRRVVNTFAAGDVVSVKVVRAAKEHVIEFPLHPMPEPEAIMRAHLLGFAAPSFQFQYVGDDKTSSLEELRGKPTVIDFWATWCQPCHEVQRKLATIKDKYGEQVNILGVSDESPEVIRRFLQRYPARYAMASDTTSRSMYAVHSIPLVVVLDAEHRVVSVLLGAEQLDLLDARLANLVK